MDADQDIVELARATPPLPRRTQQQCRRLFSPQNLPEQRRRFYTGGPPIYIANSVNHGGGNGLFSSANLPVEYYVAPYHGTIRPNAVGNEMYMFEVTENFQGHAFNPPIYIDGISIHNSTCAAIYRMSQYSR